MSKRKRFTPEQKVAIVRRHLIEKVPVSDLCDELGVCKASISFPVSAAIRAAGGACQQVCCFV